MSKLLFQGHGSYRITTDDNVVIYVDPAFGDGYDVEADIILITHEHTDHNKIEIVKRNSNTVIIRAKDLHIGYMYNKTDVCGIGIEAVEAYNSHHDKNLCVGFVLRLDNIVLYASGDTSLTEDMKNKLPNYNIDYALLPIDGIYNMDASEAFICADYIKAKHTIPIHMKPFELFNMEVASTFTHPSRLILEAGREITLD